MKKLSLLLFAFCLSVMGWALNPNTDWNRLNTYVYDMGASLTTNNDTVVLTYKLNSEAVAGGPDYDDINPSSGGTGRGIQIYLLYKDEQGEWQRVQKDDGTGDYAFYGGKFKQGDNTAKIPVATIPTNCKGKELTWEARVHGNVMRTQPTIVGAVTTKPYNAYGIAVNNDPTHKRFAQMYVSEAYPRQYSSGQYNGWNKHGEGDVYKYANQMLEYTPLLGFQCAHFKHWHNGNPSHFASTWNWTKTIENFTITCTYSHNYEPNRIKVSEDGRIFTSSFHPKASCAVVEYSRGDRDTYDLGHHFYSTITNDYNDNDDIENSDEIGGVDNPFLYRRCIGMDVKGKGENLKIILLWIDANACSYKNSNGTTVQSAKFEIYEYEIGRAEKNGISYLHPLGFGTSSGYVHKIGEYDWDYKAAISGGAFYQGARYGVRNTTAKTQLLYNNMSRGFADLAYGPNNDVWVKIDYCFDEPATAQIIRVKLSDGSTTPYTVAQNTTANYGGSGILIKGDLLITSPTDNTICMYQINANGELTATNNIPTAKYTITDNRIGTWVTGFATDFAGNLFSLTQAATNGENYTANVLGIAMPYKTAITTRAKGTFTVTDPVPNIYATNLRYEAVEGAPKYKFSFNVNTKPKYAEIRFYKSYESMKKSLSIVNADDFKEGKDKRDADLYCYYPITSGLKCGKIEVEFDMVGGVINNKLLTYPKLPRGQLYWSVYVETDKSSVFAPVYRQPLTGTDAHYHMHAIVNNNPETDQFGAIYGAQEDKSTAKQSLMIYEISDNGSDVHDINNTTRYTKKQEYLYNTSDAVYNAKPRRMAIAPDGTVYIAHEGADNQNPADQVASWKYGGIYAWNPNDPTLNGKLKLSKFSDNKIGNSSAVALYGHVNGNDTTWKMYAANSYGEFPTHGSYYTPVNQKDVTKFGWNGFVEYEKAKATNWSSWLNIANADHEYQLKQGDGSGNTSLVAMDKGVWICQHREHSIDVKIATSEVFADNRGSLVLSFVPYGNYTANADWGPRTWRSSTTDGGRNKDNDGNLTIEDEVKSELTQKDGALLQATPGAGMAYRKINGVDYLFINNHDGNIVQLQVDWKASTTPATPEVHVSKAILLTTPSDVKGTLSVNGNKNVPWKTAAISSMSFDFAGNLVTTTGVSYLKLAIPQLLSGGEDEFNTPEGGQSIIIYTMPYDRTNAREIQAPKSNIFIPERTAYLELRSEMELTLQPYIGGKPCYLDIFRPMPNTSFSTICLPFDLDMKQLTTEALKDAEVKRYIGLQLSNIGGEQMLELVFEDVPIDGEGKQILEANIPYIIQPKVRIPGIIKLQTPIQFVTIDEKSIENADNEYAITFKGVIPTQQIEVNQPLTLLLVAENRLAEMVPDEGTKGMIYGFRGYFELNKPLNGIAARITPKQSVSTSTTIIVDGKRVNIEKYLREGRVYIRVGDSLYTMDGQLVK